LTAAPFLPAAGAVVGMGTFDGVHRGHRAVLRRTAELAARHRLPSIAVTFARPPRLYFFPEKGPSLLTLLPEKIRLLKECGIDRVAVLPFGRAMAGLSAKDFFRRFFLERFRAKEIVVGYNFGFGRSRSGDTRFLEAEGRRHGVGIHVIPPVCLQEVPVSSGQIRGHLLAGDLARANRKLGYPYSLTGRVVRGQGVGKKLGFPTANLKIAPTKIVPPGVFAVRVTPPSGKTKFGLCNAGTRPTLRGRGEFSVEVHVLDFRGSLAGSVLRVEFLKKLRQEKKFSSLEALSAQIARDERAARRFFSHGH
jgi:riboflavin kinase / FMN adenylyltransferase